MGYGGQSISPMVGPTGKAGNKAPKGYSIGQVQNFTPEMMQLYSQRMSELGPDSFTARLAGGDQSAFAEAERPALKQFGQLQGSIASRFSGMGTGGRQGSGFKNTVNTAAQDFAGQLQDKRLGLRRQAMQDLQSMSTQLLGLKPYETTLTEKPKPWWQEAATSFAGGAGQSAGKALFGGF